MGWGIALAILVLLAIAPLGVSVKYESSGVTLRIIAGPAAITVLPAKKKPKKEKPAKPENKKEKTVRPKEKTPPKEPAGGKITDFLPLLQVALDFLGGFRRKLRVNRLEMKIVMAGGDPCDLAVNYGKAWAALGNLVPLLEQAFVIKKRDLGVACDFVASETRIFVHLKLTITLGRLIGLATRYGIRAVREYFKIMKSRKGGAVK